MISHDTEMVSSMVLKTGVQPEQSTCAEIAKIEKYRTIVVLKHRDLRDKNLVVE